MFMPKLALVIVSLLTFTLIPVRCQYPSSKSFINTLAWYGANPPQMAAKTIIATPPGSETVDPYGPAIDVEIVIDTDKAGEQFTINLLLTEDKSTQKQIVIAGTGFAGDVGIYVVRFYTSIIPLAGSVGLENGELVSVSCETWDVIHKDTPYCGSSSLILKSQTISGHELRDIWRLKVERVTVNGMRSKASCAEDYAAVSGEETEILTADVDAHPGEANAYQYFVGDNKAVAFINEVMFRADCSNNTNLIAGGVYTGVEVVAYGPPANYMLVVEDASGEVGYDFFEVLKWNEWEFRFITDKDFVPLYTNDPNSVLLSSTPNPPVDFVMDLRQGNALLIKLYDGYTKERSRSVLSSVSWGYPRANVTIDWSLVDVESITGESSMNMYPHTYYPLDVSPTNDLALVGNEYIHLKGEMRHQEDGEWYRESLEMCSPGLPNAGQHFYTPPEYSTTSTTSISACGAHMTASVWVFIPVAVLNLLWA
eukprot:Selendium_serpulae@DN4745_c0_g1_i2.p1